MVRKAGRLHNTVCQKHSDRKFLTFELVSKNEISLCLTHTVSNERLRTLSSRSVNHETHPPTMKHTRVCPVAILHGGASSAKKSRFDEIPLNRNQG